MADRRRTVRTARRRGKRQGTGESEPRSREGCRGEHSIPCMQSGGEDNSAPRRLWDTVRCPRSSDSSTRLERSARHETMPDDGQSSTVTMGAPRQLIPLGSLWPCWRAHRADVGEGPEHHRRTDGAIVQRAGEHQCGGGAGKGQGTRPSGSDSSTARRNRRGPGEEVPGGYNAARSSRLWLAGSYSCPLSWIRYCLPLPANGA